MKTRLAFLLITTRGSGLLGCRTRLIDEGEGQVGRAPTPDLAFTAKSEPAWAMIGQGPQRRSQSPFSSVATLHELWTLPAAPEPPAVGGDETIYGFASGAATGN